ncbi:ribosome biogenesis regulatory protein-domain-containing protein, partial [Pelagophyceae sp. CCMP2097]
MATFDVAEASPISVDAHHLLASYSCELAHNEDPLAKAVLATRALVEALFGLPVERSPVGPIARLPQPVTVLPRAKPVPLPKEETKWEAFAKTKGIVKRKESRMGWDDDQQKFAPKFGYGRADDPNDAPIIELKKTEIDIDPRERARDQKKERVQKNDKQRAGNEKRAARKQGKVVDPVAKLPIDLDTDAKAANGDKKRKRGKEAVTATLGEAQRSTASMGKFDARRDGEKAMPKATAGRKRQFASVVTDRGSDAKRAVAMMEDVLKPRAKAPKKGQKERMDTCVFVGRSDCAPNAPLPTGTTASCPWTLSA